MKCVLTSIQYIRKCSLMLAHSLPREFNIPTDIETAIYIELFCLRYTYLQIQKIANKSKIEKKIALNFRIYSHFLSLYNFQPLHILNNDN